MSNLRLILTDEDGTVLDSWQSADDAGLFSDLADLLTPMGREGPTAAAIRAAIEPTEPERREL